jgi:WD40 repeat protein
MRSSSRSEGKSSSDLEREEVLTLAFSPDNELPTMGDRDGAVRALRVRDGVEAIRITHNGGVSVLAFSPTLMATGGDTRDRSVRLWSTKVGEVSISVRWPDTQEEPDASAKDPFEI